MGDEGAFPVRSVEKGDRGGYGVVAWVYGGTGSCREMSEAGETGGGNGRGEAKEMERDERRDTKGSWEVRPREEVRVEVNEGARKVFKECEGDDTIEEEQHERGAG